MKNHALATANLTDFGDRLNDADLVIDEHHRDQNRLRTHRRFQHVEVEQAVVAHVEIRHLETFALKVAARIEHRLVLSLDGDQVFALARIEARRTLQRQVVRFGGAGGPDDFLGIGADQLGDFGTRFLDRRLGFPAESVRARRRIAEFLEEIRNHFFCHARISRRRRRIVQINRQSQHFSCSHRSVKQRSRSDPAALLPWPVRRSKIRRPVLPYCPLRG